VLLQAGSTSLSVTPVPATDGQQLPSAGLSATAGIPFTLAQPNGSTVQLQVAMSPEGLLVISLPQQGGAIDQNQAILMGLAVVQQELQVDLKNLKGIVLQE